MTLKELHDYFGTWENMTDTLGLSRNVHGHWRREKRIPWKTQMYIQAVTKGKLKARKRDAMEFDGYEDE
jgi:hypothetical protein